MSDRSASKQACRHAHERGRSALPVVDRFALVALAAAAIAGCEDATRPTEAKPQDEPAAALAPELAAEALAGIRATVGDASARLLPSLEDEVARARLRGSLGDLANSLGGGNVLNARRALAHSRREFDALAAGGAAAAGTLDLASIGLALDYAEAVLAGTERKGAGEPSPR